MIILTKNKTNEKSRNDRDYVNRFGKEGDWFFNVAGNAKKPSIDKSTINSYRDWNDNKDFLI